MDFLPCFSRNVISVSWPSFCVLRTFLRLVDVTIVSRMISWLYFLMSSFAVCLTVLHISWYFIRCLSSPFSTISRRFVSRIRVGNDNLDSRDLFIALATHEALCWIISMMV